MAFSPSALASLATALNRSPYGIGLTVQRGDNALLADQLEQIAREAHVGTDGALTLRVTHGTVTALLVESDHRPPVRYLLPPEGSEATPFLDLLMALAAPETTSAMAEPASHAELLVLVAPGCPSCPHAVRAAAMLAATTTEVALTVADVHHLTEVVKRHAIRSVPTIVLDDELAIPGVPSIRRLQSLIRERRSPAHQRRLFDSQLDAGRFSEAARLLQSHDELLEHFAASWQTSTLESRLRLMLVVEESAAGRLESLVPLLRPSLAAPSAPLRGDTADLVGRIATTQAAADLEPLLSDPHPDVVEAAAAALDDLHRRDDQPNRGP